MNRTVLVTFLSAILAGPFSHARAIDGNRVNARAVSVQWKWGLKDWVPMICSCWDRPLIGSINLFTVLDGRLSRTETIHDRMDGYAGYPAFDISGTRIAFYRAGYGPVAAEISDECETINGGQNSICVVDFEGNSLTKLCDIGTGVLGIVNDLSMGIDWPVGDWIYYVRPNEGKSSYHEAAGWRLWKVNVNTKENVAIYDPTDECGYARRFQLDLSGAHMGAQGMPAHGCDGVNINGVCSFPPNANGTLNDVVSLCGCNAAISPSGNYGANFCGSHAYLYIHRVNYSSGSTSGNVVMNTTELTTWSGDQFGLDVEGVRWACNSDKWVLQQCSPTHGSMATSDMVAGNWVDHAAIKMSNNPQASEGETANATFYFGNEPGDMWIDGGEENKGKYEDENGAWHAVPGYDPSQAQYIPVSGSVPIAGAVSQGVIPNQFMASVNNAGAIRLKSMFPEPTVVRIMDMRGSIVRAIDVSSNLTLPAGFLEPGFYLLCSQVGEEVSVSRIAVPR